MKLDYMCSGGMKRRIVIVQGDVVLGGTKLLPNTSVSG